MKCWYLLSDIYLPGGILSVFSAEFCQIQFKAAPYFSETRFSNLHVFFWFASFALYSFSFLTAKDSEWQQQTPWSRSQSLNHPWQIFFSAFTCLSLFQLCVSFFVRVWDCHSLGLSFSLYLSSLGFCWACSSFINSRSSFTSLQLHTSWVGAECFNVLSLFVH